MIDEKMACRRELRPCAGNVIRRRAGQREHGGRTTAVRTGGERAAQRGDQLAQRRIDLFRQTAPAPATG